MKYSQTIYNIRDTKLLINLIRPGGGGGGGAKSARTDFNFREVSCYLSNIYEILPLLLKFIEEQDSGKMFCQGYNLLPWQPNLRRHVDFLVLLLVN